MNVKSSSDAGGEKTVVAITAEQCSMGCDYRKNRFWQVEHYWLARLMISVSVLFSCMFLIFGHDKLYGVDKIANGAGFGIWVLLVVVLVSLADIVINDFLPRKFKFCFARKYRHLVFMALAMGVLSLVFLAVLRNGPSLAQALLSFQGIGAACVAVLDLFARHKA